MKWEYLRCTAGSGTFYFKNAFLWSALLPLPVWHKIMPPTPLAALLGKILQDPTGKLKASPLHCGFLHRSLRCLLLTFQMLCKTRAIECGLFIQPSTWEGSLCYGYGAHVLFCTVGSLAEIEAPLWKEVTHHVLNTLSIKYNFSSEPLALTSGFELSLGKPMVSWVLSVL